MAYTVETIVAEKFESIISKNITTTRSKDFYDLYMLMKEDNYNINSKTLVKAIENTFTKRNTNFDINYLKEVIEIIKDNRVLKHNFNNYKKKLEYVKDVEFEDTINAIETVIDILDKELLIV